MESIFHEREIKQNKTDASCQLYLSQSYISIRKNESEILKFLETVEILPLLRKQNVIHSDVLGNLTLFRVNIFSTGVSENFGTEFHLNEGNGMCFPDFKKFTELLTGVA